MFWDVPSQDQPEQLSSVSANHLQGARIAQNSLKIYLSQSIAIPPVLLFWSSALVLSVFRTGEVIIRSYAEEVGYHGDYIPEHHRPGNDQ